jgi:hypothetical protein
MSKSRIHFVNGQSFDITYSRVKHNSVNGSMSFSLANGKSLSVNWNNVLYIEELS